MKISSQEYKKIIRKKHKYKATATIIDGIRFPSKLEANYYEILQRSLKYGGVKYFLRQVPFHLPGNTKYLLDFMVFFRDGSINYVEIKGYDTPLSKLKRKQVQSLYPIQIEVITQI
jgi:hypothetical protein